MNESKIFTPRNITVFGVLVLMFAIAAMGFEGMRMNGQKADALKQLHAIQQSYAQTDALALAEFKGRHSGQTLTIDDKTSQRLNAGYIFEYSIGDQKYRDIKVGDIWETWASVKPDPAKDETQWIELPLLQYAAQKSP